MLQVNIQSLSHGTRSGLGHQRNLLNMMYFHRDHLHLIEEGYEKLCKTISISLMHAHTYSMTPKNLITFRWNILLSLKLLLSHPFKSPFARGRPEEKITNKRNIFTVKPIKRSLQEVVTESYAVPNVLALEVVRTPKPCSAKLSRQ